MADRSAAEIFANILSSFAVYPLTISEKQRREFAVQLLMLSMNYDFSYEQMNLTGETERRLGISKSVRGR